MKLSGGPNRLVEYHCNICGCPNSEQAGRFHREITVCMSCGSNPRFRGIVHALCCGIFNKPQILGDVPSNLPVTGLGFSDSEIYARSLHRIFAYQNTYLHQQPMLDITSSISCEQYLPVDFVICTEVFEHIAPPLQRSFNNLRSLLRPGGVLVFSVPTIEARETVEHFPDYHRASLIDLGDTHILVNRTSDGHVQVFHDLLFHGGAGEVLEMRVFSQERLLQHLESAGFTDMVVYSDSVPEIGYYWGDLPHRSGNLLGYVIAARAA
jgi:SAM-dependent methyltransferase